MQRVGYLALEGLQAEAMIKSLESRACDSEF
jgi:hypothetical protein